MSTTTATRFDRTALASVVLAAVAVVLVNLWLPATIVALAAVTLALASRRALKAGEERRGAMLAIVGFLGAGGVLIATVVPRIYVLLVYLFAVSA
ncbi:hypothetical protein [Microbacterium sp. NC79]|uniref:hypothetical protein n=1 Tax=Microbacterium sp. NC79 TaxID=2851009 RepID=UPI001C2BC971|nr:hypothetical protein [Microbacterium sp. NC79]MBV0894568.1 hypothetical protein [Microbacterium sp. NC79]